MPYAQYRFRTSNFNWRMGVMALSAAGVFLGVRQYAHSNSMVPVGISGVLVLVSLPCFLGRYDLLLDVQAGHVKDSSGFWPFATTRYGRIADFAGLEISYVVDGHSGHYTLWLIAKDCRRISLGDWDTWPHLNDRAQELAHATGWPVSDLTDGRNSLSALLRG